MGDAHTGPAGEGPAKGLPVRPRALVFFDYSCPFCYMEMFRLDRLASRHDLEIVDIPFELRPRIPLEGISAAEHGLTHTPNVEEFMLRTAAREGYPMRMPDHIPHTRSAIVMAEVARDAGLETHERVHQAILAAYFADGRDIGHKEVLLDIAEETGLSTEDVVEAWLEDTYAARLHGFVHVAGALGIGEIPAVLICNELVVGVRPYRVMEDLLSECLVTGSAEASAAGVAPTRVAPPPAADGERLVSAVAERGDEGDNGEPGVPSDAPET